jgi:hypothetical protein
VAGGIATRSNRVGQVWNSEGDGEMRRGDG